MQKIVFVSYAQQQKKQREEKIEVENNEKALLALERQRKDLEARKADFIKLFGSNGQSMVKFESYVFSPLLGKGLVKLDE